MVSHLTGHHLRNGVQTMDKQASKYRTRHAISAAIAAGVLLVVNVVGGTAATAFYKSPHTQALSGTLTVWDWQYASPTWGKALKAVDSAFIAAHPGVIINHVAQPQSNYYQLFQTANAAQSGPDVLMLHAGTFGVLNYIKSLEPLNKYITPALRGKISGWESVSANFDPRGTAYAVPGSRSGWVFYYNKALFAQAGLNPAKPPLTYSQLIADAAKLNAAGITPFGGGNADGYGALMWLNELFPSEFNIAESRQLAQGKIKYTGTKFVDLNNKIISLLKEPNVSQGWQSTPLWTDSVAQFNAGKQAIFAGIASDTLSYREFTKGLGAKNVGVFYSPGITGTKGNYIPISSGPVWAMTKYAKNKALAWSYINFISGKQGGKIQWDLAGILPINKNVTLDKGALPQATQMISDFNKGNTFLYVSSLMRQTVVNEWMKQIATVISGQQSLESALAKVQAAQDAPF